MSVSLLQQFQSTVLTLFFVLCRGSKVYESIFIHQYHSVSALNLLILSLIYFPKIQSELKSFILALCPVMYYRFNSLPSQQIVSSQKSAQSAWLNDVTFIRPPSNTIPQLPLRGPDGCQVIHLTDCESAAQCSQLRSATHHSSRHVSLQNKVQGSKTKILDTVDLIFWFMYVHYL